VRSGPAPSDNVIRAPNHLGDVVLALPAILADGSDILVVRPLAPILEMAGVRARILPLDRGTRGFARAVRELRAGGYRRGMLMSAAFSAACLLRCGGVRHLRGTRTDGRGFLLTERIAPSELRGRHRTDAFRHLLGQEPSKAPASARVTPPHDCVTAWLERLAGEGPLVGVFPGANAPARRWDADRFGRTVRQLVVGGARTVVLGSPGERALTARIATSAPPSIDLGGHTDLVDLAAILSLCDLVLANDTGPMHLAGAVGTPTVSLWGSSDPEEVRQLGAPDVRVAGAALPCAPCRRNHCRRRGRGTLLADAHEECMRLIEVADVVRAAESVLEMIGRE
jgi:heptosyltransferase-2